MPFARKLISFNWLLLVLCLALCGIGLCAIHAATYMREGQWAYLTESTQKQILWFYLGCAAMLGASLVDYKYIRMLGWPAYIVSMGLLLFLEFNMNLGPIRSATVFNATSWIDVAGFRFQPAQMAILAGILLMADYLTRLRHRHAVLRLLVCGMIMAPPAYLINDQPDLGSTFVWIPVLLTLIFLGGIPLRYLIGMGLAGMAALPILIMQMEDYKIARLTSFMHPEEDIQGTGYNAYYSMVAIGSGQWSGKGYLAEDTVNSNGYLPPPVAHNDFIFAVIGEEMGFRGAIVVVALLCMVIISLLFIGGQSRDMYGFLLCAGFAAQMFTHCFINLGMTITLVPITGLPLPFVSYGGSFLLLTLFSMGLAQSVWIHRKAGEELTQPIGPEIADYERKPMIPEPAQTVTATA